MLHLICNMILSVDLALYGVSRAEHLGIREMCYKCEIEHGSSARLFGQQSLIKLTDYLSIQTDEPCFICHKFYPPVQGYNPRAFASTSGHTMV